MWERWFPIYAANYVVIVVTAERSFEFALDRLSMCAILSACEQYRGQRECD